MMIPDGWGWSCFVEEGATRMMWMTVLMRMMMKRNPDNELLCLVFAVHDEDAGEAVADDAADDIDVRMPWCSGFEGCCPHVNDDFGSYCPCWGWCWWWPKASLTRTSFPWVLLSLMRMLLMTGWWRSWWLMILMCCFTEAAAARMMLIKVATEDDDEERCSCWVFCLGSTKRTNAETRRLPLMMQMV